MADESSEVLLSGGSDVGITLVSGADEFLRTVLGDASAKTGVVVLRVVKNAAGKPFVAVLLGGKHVGFLSHADAEGLFSTLADFEQRGVVAQAKGRVSAPPGGSEQPVLTLSLPVPGQSHNAAGASEAKVPSAVTEPPTSQPIGGLHCRNCGMVLPPDARFCLGCGTPVVAAPPPTQGTAVPTPVLPVAPRVAPVPGPVGPRAQFSGTPSKGRGWWGRRSGLQKTGVVVGAVAVLAIVASVAGTAGDKDKEAVVSPPTSVATATTAAPAEATTATTAAPTTTTTEAPTTTTTTAESSFVDGVLTTPEMIIRITDVKTIPAGATGNEYGKKPVIAFWYEITNLTDDHVSPMNWIYVFSAYQDNNPNAMNELEIASLPDDRFLDSQMETIKKGGTVANAVAYELDDEKTPVDLVASEDLGFTETGRMTYNLK